MELNYITVTPFIHFCYNICDSSYLKHAICHVVKNYYTRLCPPPKKKIEGGAHFTVSDPGAENPCYATGFSICSMT